MYIKPAPTPKIMLKRISILVILAICFSSCDNDDDLNNDDAFMLTPLLPYFSKIAVHDNVKVYLTYGDSQAVNISGNGNVMNVQFDVIDEVLTLGNNGSGASNVVIAIDHSSIDSIGVQNSGSVLFGSDFNTSGDYLAISGANSADISSGHAMNVTGLNVDLRNASTMVLANLNADWLDLNMTDGTRCIIDGTARIQHIEMDNGTRYNVDVPSLGSDVFAPAVSDSCWITTTNGAHAWVYPTIYLNATIDNGSQVYYKGDPLIEDDVSNWGDLTPKDN